MYNEEFWTAISNTSLTFDERLDIVKTCEFYIHEEPQPWCILQRFANIAMSDTPVEDAFKVAETFKNRLGLLVIVKESSYCCNKLMTIMDEFDSYLYSNDDTPFWIIMFRHAFKKTGFLYAKDVNPRVLYGMYLDKYYHTFRDSPFLKFVEPSPIIEDLVQYLHHPDRVSRWMIANPGKGVEEYLK